MNNIKINIPEDVRYILDTLENYDCEAYAVGGCVRDSLLHRTPKDWDITTNMKPNQVIDIFNDLGFNVIETGLKHGTVTVMINHIGYEITTFRVDGEYEDNRHPKEVTFTSNLKDDLSRRDFTINAMAYNDRTGLIDYFGGLEDLKNRKIRCVGNSNDRFSEDALRMLRACRFSSQLCFRMDEDIKNSFKILNPNLKSISVERIREEFNKTLLSSLPILIGIMNKYGLLQHFIPEFDMCLRTNQNNPYHIYSVGMHLIESTKSIERKLHLRLTMLLHDICKPQCKTIDENGIGHFYNHAELSSLKTKEILQRMKYDNDTINRVTTLIKYHDREISGKKSIRKLLNIIGEESFRDLLLVKEADIKAQNSKYYQERHKKLIEIRNSLDEIISQKECFTTKDLKINGKDLIELGFSQDKTIGNTLNSLLDMVLENPNLNTRESLIELANNMF